MSAATAAITTAEPVGLELDQLSHSFGNGDTAVIAFEDVSFTVAPGEIVSLVGQSGCGKSTILNILGGLLTPSAGTIRFSPPQPEPVIGYITQEDRLLPWRTVQKNVELPLELRKAPKEERAERARVLLDRVGLGDFRDRRPDELSGGMRQRAAIARALTIRPQILLMDEPFGALDAWTRNSLHELLIEIQEEFGTTIVLVTHDVFEAIGLSDRVITLAPRPGRLLSSYDVPKSAKPRAWSELQSPELFSIFTRIRNDLGLEDI